MQKKKSPRAVREPVQVYLDRPDRELLEEVAAATGLSRAEVLRRGLRRLAGETLADRAPGWSLDLLVGSLGSGSDLPTDLAEHHDEYLYGSRRDHIKRPD